VFRSRVEVVQLDVSVLDKHRRPVRGLAEKDFTILEDGRTQPIVGFSTFDVASEAPLTAAWIREVPPDVATNQHKDTRLFVIVMDDGMIPQDPFAIQSSKTIALGIIDRLGPDDSRPSCSPATTARPRTSRATRTNCGPRSTGSTRASRDTGSAWTRA
jgi:hypothetical protein